MAYELLPDGVKLILGDSNLFIPDEKLIPSLTKGLSNYTSGPVTLVIETASGGGINLVTSLTREEGEEILRKVLSRQE